jgi:hypothetical protein
MFALVLQFWGELTPSKNQLIFTLDDVIYFKGTFFSRDYKTTLYKIGWRSAEKSIPFLQSCSF